MEDLGQKGQEGQFGGENALAAVGARFMGGQARGGDPGGAKGFQAMEGVVAHLVEEGAHGFAGGVKLAKEFAGSKHISVLLQIIVDTQDLFVANCRSWRKK